MSVESVDRVEIAPGYAVPRIITGTWQLSAGHSAAALEQGAVQRRFAELVERGFDTFDTADIYTGAEEQLGRFLSSLPAERRAGVRIHTKLVPDRDALGAVDRDYVASIIDRSLRRLGVERLDLVQFAWWDYGVPGYVEAAGHLADLQAAGKIRLLGATNFDSEHLAEILDAGVGLVANQVQYSPLDTRPESAMVDLCSERGVSLLCYGALAGGLLTSAWLGVPLPPQRLANRSLVKYALIVEEFGGWYLYRELLDTLARIAERHRAVLSTVVLAWLLARPAVAAAIVGIGHRDHRDDNAAASTLHLDEADRAEIDAVLVRRRGPRGDVFELERESGGRHAEIMRYNLNREGGTSA